MGTRVRAAGVAEIGGTIVRSRRNGPATVLASLRELFPQAARSPPPNLVRLRPMTPDGPPISEDADANLFVNASQGSNAGRSLGCGRIVAESCRRSELRSISKDLRWGGEGASHCRDGLSARACGRDTHHEHRPRHHR